MATQRSQPAANRQLQRNPSNSKEAALMITASSRVLSADSLKSGSALLSCAQENLAGFGDVCPLSKKPAAVIKWGSACSGTEGAFYVAEAVNKSFAAAGHPFSLQHAFSCEQNKDKQKWIHSVLSCGPVLPEVEVSAAAGQVESLDVAAQGLGLDQAESDTSSDGEVDHSCVFSDIQSLADETAPCAVHQCQCPVPDIDLFICGISCKDVSKANPHRLKGVARLVIEEKESRGGTAQTWRGFYSFVSAKLPGLVIFENVDGLDDAAGPGTRSNLDLALEAMDALGYQAQTMTTEALEFGCPARRRRLYILFIKKVYRKFGFEQRPLTQVFTLFRSLVATCMRSPPCASAVLLDPLDSAVAAGLQEAQAKKPRAEGSGGAWVEQHLRFSESLGVRWGQPVGRDLETNDWFDTLTDREKDALKLSRLQAPDAGFRNLSQSISRVHTVTLARGKHLAPTMLPGQLLFVELTRPPRFLLGREALVMQGFPATPFLRKFAEQGYSAAVDPMPPAPSEVKKKRRRSDKPWLTEALMTDLAGNAMALPVLLAITQAALTAVPFRQASLPVTQEQTEAALQALGLVLRA